MSMEALNLKSAELRRARAELKQRLRTGQVTVEYVFGNLDEFPCVHDMYVLDVLRMVRSPNRTGRMTWQEALGRRAALDGVNLLMPVDRASQATLAWASANAPSVRRRVPRPSLVAA